MSKKKKNHRYNFSRNRKIVLASASPRRIKLLKQIGLNFVVAKPDLDENKLMRKFETFGPKKLVKILSLAKALWVCLNMSLKGNEIIVGFDTAIEYKKKMIGKPKNKKDALNIILKLSNKEHKVHTGIGLIDLKKKYIISDSETTKVYMKKILKHEALSYIKTKEPLDKAGAYAIQGKGKKLVKKIQGDYFNVVGLPLKRFLSLIS